MTCVTKWIALTARGGRFFEIVYELRVSAASDSHVSLPLTIVDFISLDPPPSYPLVSIPALAFASEEPLTWINHDFSRPMTESSIDTPFRVSPDLYL